MGKYTAEIDENMRKEDKKRDLISRTDKIQIVLAEAAGKKVGSTLLTGVL